MTAFEHLKVALVHDWLIGFGGGEKVLLALHQIFPNAPIFTSVYDPQALPEVFQNLDIRTSFLQRFPLSTRKHRLFLPLMPLAQESHDLRDYDLVISSSHACAKGVITGPDTCHISYVHTPIRYAWDMYHTYLDAQETGPLKRAIYQPILHYLRLWDTHSSTRVDHFIANSNFVRQRIQKYYRRDAQVIYPPLSGSPLKAPPQREDFYLMVNRLVPYKRTDLAIEAFQRLKKPLKIVGVGPERQSLEKRVGNTTHIQFLGHVPDPELHTLYAQAKALVFPGIEDFGMVPIEAQLQGCPVIAFNKGGARDTVQQQKTGFLYTGDLAQAIETFETLEFTQETIQAHAQTFNEARFRQEIQDAIHKVLATH